jgi:hypothetical protein
MHSLNTFEFHVVAKICSRIMLQLGKEKKIKEKINTWQRRKVG